MKIKGLQKLTRLDYPDKVACTVFLGGCNFRCPFCHNASLVLEGRDGGEITEEEFFAHLEARRGRLSGVCVSGGEPTLQAGLPDFLKKIKDMGYAVKLDTNGYRPAVLKSLVGAGLVDYVAMDIKNSADGYAATAGIGGMDISPILESAAYLMSGVVEFEFRTTVVRELHSVENIRAIGEWLLGDERFYLQSFKDSGDLIADGLSAYSEDEMRGLLSELRKYIPKAELRG